MSKFKLTLRKDRPATIEEHAALRARIEQLEADQAKLISALQPFANANYYAVLDMAPYRTAYDTIRAIQQKASDNA